MATDWDTLRTALIAHLGHLERQLRDVDQVEAADLLRPVATDPPWSQFGTASDWLGEVELVADAILRRFPPPHPLDEQVREAKRLARVGLYGKPAAR